MPRRRRVLGAALLIVLLVAAGSYLGGQTIGVCTVGASAPPGPATCRTVVRLSATGAVAGTLVALTVVGTLSRRSERTR